MVSVLSREKIELYYAEVFLPRVSFGDSWEKRYDSPRETQVRLEFDQESSVDRRIYYRVIVFDVGLDVNYDLRCH